MKRQLLPLAIALAGFSLHGAAQEPATQAAAPTSVESLEQRLQRIERLLGATSDDADDGGLVSLDQRLKVIERKLELQQEATDAQVAKTPVLALGDRGLGVKTPSGDFELKVRALVQADQRSYFDDKVLPQTEGFLFRRVRPTIEGSFGSLVGFRLTPEFAGDSATIVDAYVDVKFNPAYTLRVGKVKGPISLERLQSGSATNFVERGFPAELAPNRDIGAQLQGELSKGRVNYVIGVYNGSADGRDAPTTDGDENAEFAGRIFFEPWKNSGGAMAGLGFGVAGSVGDKEGIGNNFLPRYRTPGQAVFFNYRATVLADGEHARWSPQFFYYRNAFGVLGEYISSSQEVSLAGVAGSQVSLDNRAWQLTGGWVLTGEDAGYRGVIKPAHPFVASGEGWGAFELVARYSELDIDDDAFPLYANPASAASNAKSWGLGLNWYLNSNLKFVFNHTQTRFNGGAVAGTDREDEKTFFTRLQFAF
jgi:phosphate-selective porin OprO/OprP